MAGRRRDSANSRCPACGKPWLVQWVGHRAALQARVDLPPPDEPRPYGPAAAASTPNDLVWCLPRRNHGSLLLRWTTRSHPPDCPHQHLLTHKCPPTTLF